MAKGNITGRGGGTRVLGWTEVKISGIIDRLRGNCIFKKGG